jgi:phage shock protein A
MAGLISRLKRITVSRIIAFLETVDDPDAVFPQLIREMQRRIEEAVNAERKAAAALKANQRRLDESTGRAIRLDKGSEMALRQGDEALAREALAELIKNERAMEVQNLALTQSENALLNAREVRLHLQTQLEELKRRKEETLARARSTKHLAENYQWAGDIRKAGAAILDEVSRMEKEDGEKSFLPVAGNELTAAFDRSLEGRLRALEREAEIERRLDSIRSRKQLKSNRDA